MADKYILDTHALVWYLEGNKRLSQPARATIDDPASELVLPVIALAEAAFVVEKGRTNIPKEENPMNPLKLSQEELAGYRAAARRQAEQEQQALARREQRAWALARQAAELLPQQFGAARIVLFGSLSRPGGFTPWSDVDIAAWGLRPEDTFRAIGAVMDLAADIEVNLVDVQTCSASLLAVIGYRTVIERYGVGKYKSPVKSRAFVWVNPVRQQTYVSGIGPLKPGRALARLGCRSAALLSRYAGR